MSPLELLKKGILTSDWDAVSQAYKTLTGKTVKPKVAATPDKPKPKRRRSPGNGQSNTIVRKVASELEQAKEARQSASEAPTSIVRPSPVDEFAKFKVEPPQPKNSEGKRASRVEPFQRPTTNEFEDLGLAQTQKAASSFDKKLAKVFTPTPRVATAAATETGLVDATCLHCKNPFKCEAADLRTSLDDEQAGPVGVCLSCMKATLKQARD